MESSPQTRRSTRHSKRTIFCTPTTQIETYRNVLFFCTQCDFSSRYKGILKTHMKCHSTPVETPLSNEKITDTVEKKTTKEPDKESPDSKESSFSRIKASGLFQCAHCDYSSRFQGILETHEEISHEISTSIEPEIENTLEIETSRDSNTCSTEVSKFHCPICKLFTNDAEILKYHMAMVHPPLQRSKQCGPEDVNQSVNRNESDSSSHKFENNALNSCTLCEFSTLYKGNLTSHMKNVHYHSKEPSTKIGLSEKKQNISKFFCGNCQFSTFYKGNLKSHIATVHSRPKTKAPNTTLNPDQCENSSKLKSNFQKYNCEFCNFSTYYKGNLKTHIITVHTCSKTKPLKAALSPNENGKARALKSNNRKYYCDLCIFSSHYEGNLRKHTARCHSFSKEKVENASLFKDDLGGGASVSPKSAPQTPNNGPIYYCAFCDFSTTYKWNMKPHMNSHSTGSSFVCSICSFSFRSMEILEKHENLHFRNDTLLQQETRSVTNGKLVKSTETNDNTEEKLLSDATMEAEVSSSSSSNNFFISTNLSNTSNARAEEDWNHGLQRRKIISCDICSATFVRKQNLKRHQKKFHEIQKRKDIPKQSEISHVRSNDTRKDVQKQSFACNICDRVFNYKFHLGRHALTHKRENELGTPPTFGKINKNCSTPESTITKLKNEERHHLEASILPEKHFSPKQFLVEELIVVNGPNSGGKSSDGNKCFFCKLCGCGYTRQYNLIAHIRHYHPTSVLKAGTTISSPPNLRQPAESLRSPKVLCNDSLKRGPFSCDHCDKEFFQMGWLVRHVYTCHKDMSFNQVKIGDGAETECDRNVAHSSDNVNTLTNRIEILDSFEPSSNDGFYMSDDNRDVANAVFSGINDRYEELKSEETDTKAVADKYLSNYCEDNGLEFENIPCDDYETISNHSSQITISNVTSLNPELELLFRECNGISGENSQGINDVFVAHDSDDLQIKRDVDSCETKEHGNSKFGKRPSMINEDAIFDTEEGPKSQKCNQLIPYIEEQVDVATEPSKVKECSVYLERLPSHYSSYVAFY